jgi:hypothetical protein
MAVVVAHPQERMGLDCGGLSALGFWALANFGMQHTLEWT